MLELLWRDDYIVTTVLGLTLLYLFVRFYLGEEKKPVKLKDESCGSADCVRCNKYSKLRGSCVNELHCYISDRESEEGLERIIHAVKQSYQIQDEGRQQPNVLYMRDLEGRPIWTDQPSLTTICDILQTRYQEIVEEYQAVKSLIYVEHGGWKRNTTETGSWETFYIYNQGQEVIDNSCRCPVLKELIQTKLQRSCMTGCVFGNVFFSKLNPGTHISAHYGPCNVRLRCHLGLHIPEGWTITVDNNKYTWQQHKCIVFDDSFLHSVSYDGDQHDGQSIREDSADNEKSIREDAADRENSIRQDAADREKSIREDSADNEKSIREDAADRENSIREDTADREKSIGQDTADRENSIRQDTADREKSTSVLDDSNCRVVLIIDLWHPDLTLTERQALTAIYKA